MLLATILYSLPHLSAVQVQGQECSAVMLGWSFICWHQRPDNFLMVLWSTVTIWVVSIEEGFHQLVKTPQVLLQFSKIIFWAKIPPEFLIVLIIKLSALSTKQLKFSKYVLKLSGWVTPLLQVGNWLILWGVLETLPAYWTLHHIDAVLFYFKQ